MLISGTFFAFRFLLAYLRPKAPADSATTAAKEGKTTKSVVDVMARAPALKRDEGGALGGRAGGGDGPGIMAIAAIGCEGVFVTATPMNVPLAPDAATALPTPTEATWEASNVLV
eukprot:7177175-Prymnesium_polylepis.3